MIFRTIFTPLKMFYFLLIISLSISFPLFSQSKIFYLSPTGSDENTGTREQPLATLNGARGIIKNLKSKGVLKDSIIFRVTDGLYFMDMPLILKPNDSGTKKYPILFESAKNVKPVFSGGKKITGFVRTESGLWKTVIPEAAYKNYYFEQLYVNGRRAVRAKSPNKGYFTMKDVKENVWLKGQGRALEKAQQIISADPINLYPLRNLPLTEFSEIVMTVYHKWDVTIRHLDGFTDSTLITSGQGMKPWNLWGEKQRYILENFKSALDAPGEWFLERNGNLWYKPFPDEKIGETEFIAPVLEKFVILQGSATNGQFVQHIQFKGLTFKHAAYHLPATGFEPAQAANNIEAVFQIDGARHIRIENCEITRTGTYGIWFRKGCSDCVVEKSYIHNLGAGGVRIGDTVLPENEVEITRRISLENNIIQSGGHIFPCAVGVLIGHSSDNIVNHNEISDFYYTGVSVGWRWGYDYSPAKRNQITCNHIHHIGWGVLSDMAGVYTLGPSEGTVVNNNHIHHIYAYSYGGWGLYTDEGSSHILMKNNLVHHTKTGGFHQHYGKENVIRNNIFAFSKLYQVQATRVEKHLSFRFSNNIIYFTEGVLFQGPWNSIKVELDSNCYWNPVNPKFNFLQNSFADWEKTGLDSHSIIANPYFENPETSGFSFKKTSTYKKIGFIPFDYSKAGVYGDREWVELAKLDQKRIEKFAKIFKYGTTGE